MKINKKILLIATGSLLLGFFLAWLIVAKPDSEHRDQSELKDGSDEHTIWTCSMHPQVRKKEAGDCPICGMDLIPLENAGYADSNPLSIHMSPTAMQLANVSTAIVGASDAVKSIELTGKVQEDERRTFSQSSHIPGRIESLNINFTGEHVNKGQIVAYIYSPELQIAQEELKEAYKVRESQAQLYRSAREKLRNWKLSESEINRLLQSEASLDKFPIRADISGYVTEKSVEVGDYVQKGQSIYKIAELSQLWVLFDIYETDLAWVNEGDKITFNVASLPGKTFTEEISFIDPIIDPQTRVAKARVEVKNEDMKLKPEMFVSGRLTNKLQKKDTDAVVVPKSAVMWTGKRSVVYVKSSSEQGIDFIMREVVLGPELGESYVIQSGLQKGEEIAVQGTFSIDAAAQLAGKPSMMNPEGGASMGAHQHSTVPVSNSTATTAKQSFEVSQEAKKELQSLVKDYISLKDALTKDKLNETRNAAENMQNRLASIEMSVFKGNSHENWMILSKKIATNLQGILSSTKIEMARNTFRELSVNMIELVESFKPLNEKIYIQHCPMANNNKGADWLSFYKDIKNPYFGATMLNCGEVIKIIK